MLVDRRTKASLPVLAVFLALASPSLAAGARPLSSLTSQSYGTRDGLPSKLVSSMVLDRKGFLWLGTPEGLTRFDGSRFETFDRRTTPSFQSHNVGSLLEDGAGLYVGTGGGGLYRFEEDQVELVAGPGELPHSEVVALQRGASGEVWIGTRGGLCRRQGGELTCFDESDGLPSTWVGGYVGAPSFQALAVDREGRLWVATAGGLAFRDGDAFAAVALADDDRVVAVSLGPGGSLWAGTQRGAVGRVTPEGFEGVFELGDGVAVSSLLETPSGALFVGTSAHGLARWDDGRLEWMRERDGLPGDSVESMLLDGGGEIWVGGFEGLSRISDAIFTQYGERHGLVGEFVVGLSPGRGGFWTVTKTGGLQRFESGRFVSVLTDKDAEAGRIRRVLESRSGRLFVGGRDGLFELVEGALQRFGDGLVGESINALFEDSRGRLWVGTGASDLFRFDGQQWVTLGSREGLPGVGIFSLAEAPGGVMYVGTRKGLVRWTEEEVRLYDQDDGLPDPLVMALHLDAEGRLWIGTVSQGLVLFDGTTFRVIGERRGLPDNTVWAILEDDFGAFWMSSNRGVARVAKEDLLAVAADRSARVSAYRYGPSEGLLETDCIGGFLSSAIVTEEGWLAFATSGGVAVVEDPSRSEARLPPPAVEVVSLVVDGERASPKRLEELPPGVRRIEIGVSAPTLASPDQVRLRHRLLGLDKDWQELGRRREIVYTNLRPGRWTLELASSRERGGWSTPRSFPLVVQPRWFQRRDLQVIALVAVVLAMGWLYRWRTKSLLDHQEELSKRVEERTAELRQLVEVTRAINEGVLLEEVLDRVYDSFRCAIPYDRIGLALLDETGEFLTARWSRSEGRYPEISEGYRSRLQGSSLEVVIRRGEPRILDDLETYLREHPESDATQRLVATGLRSSLTCPLYAMGRIVGCLFFSSAEKRTYGPPHVRFFEQIGSTLSATIEKARLHRDLVAAEEQLREASRTDYLTGISNRRALIELAEQESLRSERSGRPFSLILADIDHFKRVNDTHGHEVGDEALVAVARLLQSLIRRQDRLARWGGEEFLMLLPETEGPGAAHLAEKLRQAVAATPIETAVSTLEVEMTFGVSVLQRRESFESCLARADRALYEGKRRGRNRVVPDRFEGSSSEEGK